MVDLGVVTMGNYDLTAEFHLRIWMGYCFRFRFWVSRSLIRLAARILGMGIVLSYPDVSNPGRVHSRVAT